jgi:hypothetical protein
LDEKFAPNIPAAEEEKERLRKLQIAEQVMLDPSINGMNREGRMV